MVWDGIVAPSVVECDLFAGLWDGIVAPSVVECDLFAGCGMEVWRPQWWSVICLLGLEWNCGALSGGV